MAMNVFFSKRMSTLLIRFLQNFTNAEVLCPVNVCYTVPVAIYLSGNCPKFYDVDALTGIGTLESIKRRFSPQCKVIIFVFQYGNVIDIQHIRKYAKKNNIYLILDYASCFMTEENIPALNTNELGFLSFGYAKQLELGFGGAVITYSKEITWLEVDNTEGVMSLEDYVNANDLFERYIKENYIINVDDIKNSRMSDAFLKEINKNQLLRAEKFFYSNHKKIKNHKRNIDNIYIDRIRENDHIKFYTRNSKYPSWRFNILTDKQDLILAEILSKGYFASKWYPPVSKRFGDNEEYLGAEKHSEMIINLFNDKRISVADACEISEIVNEASV